MVFIRAGRAVGCHRFCAAASNVLMLLHQKRVSVAAGGYCRQPGEQHLAGMGQGPRTPIFLPNTLIFWPWAHTVRAEPWKEGEQSLDLGKRRKKGAAILGCERDNRWSVPWDLLFHRELENKLCIAPQGISKSSEIP